MIYLVAFVLLTLLFRLAFGGSNAAPRQLPVTVEDALRSDIPLWWKVDQATCDKGSEAVCMNTAAARLHMRQPLAPHHYRKVWNVTPE